MEAFYEPEGRASSPLHADGCNHAFLHGKGRRAPVLRSTNAKRGHQPIATAEGGRSDAPYLGQPSLWPDARPILKVATLREPLSNRRVASTRSSNPLKFRIGTVDLHRG